MTYRLVWFILTALALGGWLYVFTGKASRPWNGLVALLICVVIGGGWGLVAYKFQDREFGNGGSGWCQDEATGMLFANRVMVVVTCLAGLYFIWELAKGI